MSIITPNDFKGGEQAIAQLSNLGVQENVQSFIDEYETEFLKKLLGVDLYNDFIAGLALEPIPEKWVQLRDETDLKMMIKCYVYYHYMESETTTTSGTGVIKAKNENSIPANNWDKLVKAWNRMANATRLFDLSTDTYPEFTRVYWRRYDWWHCGCEVDEIYYFKNTLNF